MLDSIVYGNPTREYLPYLEATSFLDKHLESLKNFTPPKNSSKATREELNNLVDLTNELATDPTFLYAIHYYKFEMQLSKTGYADLNGRLQKLESDIKKTKEVAANANAQGGGRARVRKRIMF